MTSPAESIVEAVEAACDVDHALPYRPARLDGKMAFVAPAAVWKEIEERFCGISIGLDVYLVAGSSEQVLALAWLDAQSTILLNHDPIDVGVDTVIAGPVDAPFVFSTTDGSTFFACRVAYSRFTNGD